MITYQKYDVRVDDRFYAIIDCLSTDEKPTAHIYNGSELHEIDTGKKWHFDQESGTWYEGDEGGEGGAILGTVTLSTTWTGSDPYTQAVSISGSTAHSKIDLQPSQAVYAQMLADGCTALWCVNDNGAITVCAMSHPLTQAVTVQYTRMEVET